MNEMNFYVLNGIQYEVADKQARENLKGKVEISHVNQTFAPAVSVTTAGTAVSTDQIMTTEHRVECKVKRVNLLNYNAIPNSKGIKNHGYGTITVTPPSTGAGVPMGLTILQLLPDARVGESVVFQAETNGRYKFIYLEYGGTVKFGLPYTITEKDINGYILVYGNGSNTTPCEYKKLRATREKQAPFVPYIDDLSAVKVSQYGKNLLPSFPAIRAKNGITWTINDDGTVEADGTATDLSYISYCEYDTESKDHILPPGRYNLSGCPSVPVSGIAIWLNAGIAQDYGQNGDSGVDFTIEGTESFRSMTIRIERGTTVHHIKFKPMIKLAGMPEGYVMFVKPKNYKPSTGGIVSGMTSISPVMTIITDNPNVTVEITYHVDTKKYVDSKFAALQTAILSTGGDI